MVARSFAMPTKNSRRRLRYLPYITLHLEHHLAPGVALHFLNPKPLQSGRTVRRVSERDDIPRQSIVAAENKGGRYACALTGGDSKDR